MSNEFLANGNSLQLRNNEAMSSTAPSRTHITFDHFSNENGPERYIYNITYINNHTPNEGVSVREKLCYLECRTGKRPPARSVIRKSWHMGKRKQSHAQTKLHKEYDTYIYIYINIIYIHIYIYICSYICKYG